MRRATVREITPKEGPSREMSACPYPVRIPDGEYAALCTHVYHDQHSRNYGERVYLEFQIYLGEYAGKTVRMFLRPSVFPTSMFYRAWSIAHGGPPRSRNTKMSARTFKGKLFRVLTATVKPKHKLTGEDGKSRPGPPLPENFWYSKIACLLSLEVTNDPLIVTEFPHNSFPVCEMSQGGVGSGELGDGSKRDSEFVPRDGKPSQHHTTSRQGTANSLPTPSPPSSGTKPLRFERLAGLKAIARRNILARTTESPESVDRILELVIARANRAGTPIHSPAYLEGGFDVQLEDDAVQLERSAPEMVTAAPDMRRKIALVLTCVERADREGRPSSDVLAELLAAKDK
ncbi:MAG TPA: hypothetical protein VMB47_03990 [Candidatus Aquilonibacter sp.]|nr:hypothetical protein [Candidatus Aquilonibacter sp.]